MSDLVGNPEDQFSQNEAQLWSDAPSSFIFPITIASLNMQYTAIFHGCKNDNFQMTNCDIFLVFAQVNVRTAIYVLEHKHYKMYNPVNPSFTI